ncbi:MAG: metal ABC transporter permease [Desulfurococcales archaeon]|nr:metal ABC transporter permease [Desulfurococcales archaeon]
MLFEIRWLILITLAGLAFGVLSPIVTARKMMFLAAAMPHSALLAAVIGIPLSITYGLSPGLWAIIIGTPLPLIIYALEKKGVEEDVGTSVYVAATASLSVALMYYVLTSYPMESSLWSYILGDPLLSTWSDVYLVTIITVALLALLVPFMREQILMGVDRDFAVSSGIHASLYDIIFLLLLSLSTIGFMRTVGYVLEHVLILLPASLALLISKSGRDVVLFSITSAVLSAIIGLLLGISLNLQVSASVGLVLLIGYILAIVWRR